MSITLSSRARVLAVALLAVALAAGWLLRPAPAESSGEQAVAAAAIPTSQRAGTLRLSGISTAVLPIRSFSITASKASAASKATFGDAKVATSATGVSPAILRAVATGTHLPKVTVVLYHPGTTTRFQQWELADATFSLSSTAKSGNGGETNQSLAITYSRFTQRVYAANGTTQVGQVCFDVAANVAC
ncbi:MAG TPA: type VI secretion system tube protein Hcp [Nocardioides sp.]|nr:type VI secretion system tube protein Hcp [Nocardioides sp.]